jgi:hypothetical protein
LRTPGGWGREEAKARGIPDPKREAVGLPIGATGGYFVGAAGFAGQDRDDSIVDYNSPPPDQPGLWCQWVPLDQYGGHFPLSEEDTSLTEGVYSHFGWDGGEKFYGYVEWLTYLRDHFLQPWGYVLSGEVTWQGEDSSDMGKIVVNNNQIAIKRGRVSWE